MMEYLLIGIIINMVIQFTRFIRRKYRDTGDEVWSSPIYIITVVFGAVVLLSINVLLWPLTFVFEIIEIIRERKVES